MWIEAVLIGIIAGAIGVVIYDKIKGKGGCSCGCDSGKKKCNCGCCETEEKKE